MKSAKKFTRDQPATKVDIWNGFRRESGFPAIPVVEAKSFTGDNCPKYLVREGYLRAFSAGGVDFYQLTAEGISWLLKGIHRYMDLHPEAASELRHPIPPLVVRRPRLVMNLMGASGTPIIRRKRG